MRLHPGSRLMQEGIEVAASAVWQNLKGRQTPIEAAEQQLIRDLGVACHRRMLELHGTDPDAAIELALVGEGLYRHLQQQDPDQPDWVAVHDEQFCRYGAIWIHDQLSAGSCGLDPERHEQRRQLGIALLDRLATLHGEPPYWLPVMRQSLERLAPPPPPAPSTLLQIAVVGNCQTHPLFLGLQEALPHHAIHFCTPVHMATPADVAQLHRVLADTDLLVMHRILPGYRDDIGLDGPTLRARLPPKGRQLVLPNLHYEGYHPLIGYANIDPARQAGLAAESPLGDYHDFLAMAAAHRGIDATQLLELRLRPAMAERLRQWHAASLDQLRQREAECDLALSPWIEQHWRSEPLFHTINHPSNRLLEQLLAAVLAWIQPEQPPSTPSLGDFEYLGQHHHGVVPWVWQALELGPWAVEGGRREWTYPWSLRDQLHDSIDFYNRHPWIANDNQTLAKFQLASDLLDLSSHSD